MSKRFYWMKLKENFYDSMEIKRIIAMPDGYEMLYIYQRVILSALNSDGILRYDGEEESFAMQIALSLGVDAEKVEALFKQLLRRGMMEQISENEYYIPEAVESSGKEWDSAERMRRKRKTDSMADENTVNESNTADNKDTASVCHNENNNSDDKRHNDNDNIDSKRHNDNDNTDSKRHNVTPSSHLVTQRREDIDIEKEKDIDTDKSSSSCAREYNSAPDTQEIPLFDNNDNNGCVNNNSFADSDNNFYSDTISIDSGTQNTSHVTETLTPSVPSETCDIYSLLGITAQQRTELKRRLGVHLEKYLDRVLQRRREHPEDRNRYDNYSTILRWYDEDKAKGRLPYTNTDSNQTDWDEFFNLAVKASYKDCNL